MSESIVLGMDCGGTHTDAALLALAGQGGKARLLASAKTVTRQADLPASIRETLDTLIASADGAARKALARTERATIGTTLAINALVQDRADKVGLALSGGPGLDPRHFALGDFVCVAPGGLDHRGVEVSQLCTDGLRAQAAKWPAQGVAAVACVSKFSPRNPAHEQRMAKVAAEAANLPVTMGHSLSGQLNFPRRVTTAYYNAAVSRLHNAFLDAVEDAFAAAGLKTGLRLLKADGGAIPFSLSRREPAQSILSGPAASVMGALALWPDAGEGCSLLFDIGGTTTDMAMFLNGSPVVDRKGMLIKGRRALVRSLASVSIGVGGDSLLHFSHDALLVGPMREGPAAAFGGANATLLDALNTLDGEKTSFERGDVAASREAVARLAASSGLGGDKAAEIAQKAVDNALAQIVRAASELVENINGGPIYTLAALKAARQARPTKACLVGGPAQCLAERLARALGLEVDIAPHPQVANAIGAALTLPTASLEAYVDTGKGVFSVPSIDYAEKISRNFSLENARARAMALLESGLEAEGITDANVEVVEADLFATLDERGYGSKDMRIRCQATPGIAASIA